MKQQYHPHTEEWHLDRKVGVSALVSGVSSFIIGISLIAGLSARVGYLEANAAELEAEMRGSRLLVVSVARMEERLEALQKTLEAMRTEIRQFSRLPYKLPDTKGE